MYKVRDKNQKDEQHLRVSKSPSRDTAALDRQFSVAAHMPNKESIKVRPKVGLDESCFPFDSLDSFCRSSSVYIFLSVSRVPKQNFKDPPRVRSEEAVLSFVTEPIPETWRMARRRTALSVGPSGGLCPSSRPAIRDSDGGNVRSWWWYWREMHAQAPQRHDRFYRSRGAASR